MWGSGRGSPTLLVKGYIWGGKGKREGKMRGVDRGKVEGEMSWGAQTA